MKNKTLWDLTPSFLVLSFILLSLSRLSLHAEDGNIDGGYTGTTGTVDFSNVHIPPEADEDECRQIYRQIKHDWEIALTAGKVKMGLSEKDPQFQTWIKGREEMVAILSHLGRNGLPALMEALGHEKEIATLPNSDVWVGSGNPMKQIIKDAISKIATDGDRESLLNMVESVPEAINCAVIKDSQGDPRFEAAVLKLIGTNMPDSDFTGYSYDALRYAYKQLDDPKETDLVERIWSTLAQKPNFTYMDCTGLYDFVRFHAHPRLAIPAVDELKSLLVLAIRNKQAQGDVTLPSERVGSWMGEPIMNGDMIRLAATAARLGSEEGFRVFLHEAGTSNYNYVPDFIKQTGSDSPQILFNRALNAKWNEKDEVWEVANAPQAEN